MILTEQRIAIGSDEGVILVQGGWGPSWGHSTLVEVHEAGAFGDVSEGTHMWVIAAHQWGPYEVRARILDSPPGEPEGTWEDVAEVSLTCRTGLYISDLGSEEDGLAIDLDPGTYRVRVSASGRAADWWEQEQQNPNEWGQRPAVEHYLIDVWAAPASPPEDLRESSTFAHVTRGHV